jgi:hypothetical protein
MQATRSPRTDDQLRSVRRAASRVRPSAARSPACIGKYQMADKKRQSVKKSTTGTSMPPSDLSGSIKRRRGNQPFLPSQDQRKIVMLSKSLGYTHAQIGRLLDGPDRPQGVSADTVERHFAPELQQGEDRANLAVAANLFAIATGQTKYAVTAAIFWLKCRAGWRADSAPAVTVIPTKEEDQPIKFTINLGPVPHLDEDIPNA